MSKPSVSRGRWLSCIAIRFKCAWECRDRSLPFGQYCRSSPLVFSFELRCHELRDLETLLVDADHVVLAAPETKATRRFFDDAAFAAMKPGAHLVNIARGGLVDPSEGD